MLVKLGLSGSIATGKTSRCNHLVSNLAPSRFTRVRLLSADFVGHNTYLPGTDAYDALILRFGDRILDRNIRVPPVEKAAGGRHLPIINRKVLGSIVFQDPTALSDLNGIVWSAIKKTIADEIVAFETKVRLKEEAANIAGRVSSGANTNSNYAIDANILICEAALLTEAGLDSLFDEVWLLGCDADEAVRRITKRDGLGEDDARRRIASQKSMSERQRILEEKGFVTSTPADNKAFLESANSSSKYYDAKRILRTFDTTRHASPQEGLGEITEGFNAFAARWIPKGF